MAVNTAKQAKERWQLGLKELEKRQKSFAENPTDDARKAFDEQMAEVDRLQQDAARFADYEARMAANLLDGDLQDPDRKTAEELAGMTSLEKRSDKVNPFLNPDAKGYSLARVIDRIASGKPLTGVELEVSQEMERRGLTNKNSRSGNDPRAEAVVIPLTLGVRLQTSEVARLGRLYGLTERESRAMTAANSTAAIPTILDTTVIEMLRNKVVLQRAGATVLTGITGVFDMPKQSGQPSVTIGGESVTQSESAALVNSKVTFTPKTITGNSKVTRRFMVQAMASFDAENFLRMMLLNQIALGIDFEGINGPGTSNRATGLLQNSGVTTIALGTNGGAPTFAKLVDMETDVADANAEGNSMAYITNAKGRGLLKQTLKASSAGSTMLWENDMVNSYPAYMSNQMPKNLTKGTANGICSSMLFGDFSQAIIALWTGVDILADPYTGGNEGATSIYAHQDFDFQVRYDEAFSKIVDMLA